MKFALINDVYLFLSMLLCSAGVFMIGQERWIGFVYLGFSAFLFFVARTEARRPIATKSVALALCLLLAASTAQAEMLLTTKSIEVVYSLNGPTLPSEVYVDSPACGYCGPIVALDYAPSFSIVSGMFDLPIELIFDAGLSGNPTRMDSGAAFDGFSDALEGDDVNPEFRFHFLGGVNTFWNVEFADLWGSPYTPPNGATLAGTELEVSALEFTITDIVPEVIRADMGGVNAIVTINFHYDFDLAIYAVPEPNSLWLLLGYGVLAIGYRRPVPLKAVAPLKRAAS